MNYEEYMLTSKAPRRREETEPAEQAAGINRKLALNVPECDHSSELICFTDSLLASLASQPTSIHLRFVGGEIMPPDPALVIYDILINRPKNITIITEAWSPVLDSGILIWLAGDVRRCRATTYLHFRSLQTLLNRRRDALPWEEGEKVHFDRLTHKLYQHDYKTVLSLLDEYLTVGELADKIITPAMLRDFGLLDGERLDELLQTCLANNPAGGKNPDNQC